MVKWTKPKKNHSFTMDMSNFVARIKMIKKNYELYKVK